MSEQNQTPDWREALLSIWNKPILKNMRFIFNIAYSVLKNIFVIAILALMLIGVFGGGIGLGYFASLTSNEEPLTQEQMSDAIGNLNLISSFYYQDGTKISDVNTDELRIVKPLSEISQYVKDGSSLQKIVHSMIITGLFLRLLSVPSYKKLLLLIQAQRVDLR